MIKPSRPLLGQEMALNKFIALFKKLRLHDDGKLEIKKLPEVDARLAKIKAGVKPKYLNLDTGRVIIESSALHKKYINKEWYYCGDNPDLFEKVTKKLAETSLDEKPTKKNPSKRRAIPKALRHVIWMRDYGNVAEAKCFCCGVITVTEATAEAGHIIAFSKGGSNDKDNLRLICRTCNADMGTENMDEFMKANNYPLV